MNINQFVYNLETQVDPTLVEQTRDWSDENKLYVYLHTIQLEHMRRFEEKLNELR